MPRLPSGRGRGQFKVFILRLGGPLYRPHAKHAVGMSHELRLEELEKLISRYSCFGNNLHQQSFSEWIMPWDGYAFSFLISEDYVTARLSNRLEADLPKRLENRSPR